MAKKNKTEISKTFQCKKVSRLFVLTKSLAKKASESPQEFLPKDKRLLDGLRGLAGGLEPPPTTTTTTTTVPGQGGALSHQ